MIKDDGDYLNSVRVVEKHEVSEYKKATGIIADYDTLCGVGTGIILYEHVLVAVHTIQNPDNLPCVKHLDYDIKNNVSENLAWCSREDFKKYLADGKDVLMRRHTPIVIHDLEIEVKHILTHNSKFHADEVAAIALLRVYNPKERYRVIRVGHDLKDTDLSKYSYVIDVGRVHDGVKHFDHHQYEKGKSSCGLILDYVKDHIDCTDLNFSTMDKMVQMIDENDVGVRKAAIGETSYLVSLFNTDDIYSAEQDLAFEKAVEFMVTVFSAIKQSMEAEKIAKLHVAKCSPFKDYTMVMDLEVHTPRWGAVINAVLTPEIEAVVWFNPGADKFYIKVVNLSEDSYEQHGRKLKQHASASFVHLAGFLGVFNTKEKLMEYLEYMYSCNNHLLVDNSVYTICTKSGVQLITIHGTEYIVEIDDNGLALEPSGDTVYHTTIDGESQVIKYPLTSASGQSFIKVKNRYVPEK